MPFRRLFGPRSLLVLGLTIAYLPSVATTRLDLATAATPCAGPQGCCPRAPVPACPACPSEERSSCPAPASRARACSRCDALPPGGTSLETRQLRREQETSSRPATASSAPARLVSGARRAVVQGTSPPLQLLACSFRN